MAQKEGLKGLRRPQGCMPQYRLVLLINLKILLLQLTKSFSFRIFICTKFAFKISTMFYGIVSPLAILASSNVVRTSNYLILLTSLILLTDPV